MNLFLPKLKTSGLQKLLLCFCFCIVNLCTGNATEITSEKKNYVLILNTYDESFAWSNSVFSPLIHEVSTMKNIDAYIEHLNFYMVNDTVKICNFPKELHAKYGNTPPRVLIMLGSSSMVFMDEINKFWGEVPTILCGASEYCYPLQSYIDLNDSMPREVLNFSELKNKFNFTFMYAPAYLKENVKLIQQMIPGMKKLIFISDKILPNRVFCSKLREIIKADFPDLTYQHLSTQDIPLNHLCDSLRKNASESGILVSTWFSPVAISNNYLVDVSRSIANTHAPLFTLRYTGTEDGGMIGGYMYDEEHFTEHLLQSFRDIVNGKPARNIPHYYPTNGYPVINYTTLINKGLDPNLCPKNTVFINKPVGFWKKYQWGIVGIIIVITLIAIAQQRRILILKELRKSQKKEYEVNLRYMDLIDNMPIVYAQEEAVRNVNGEIVDMIIRDVNRYFEICFWKRKEVIGKKATDVFSDIAQDFAHFIKIVLTEKKKVTFPYYFKHNNIFYDVVMSCSGKTDCVDIFCIDSTELHQAQQQLSSTNRKLSIALDVANIVPWKWDLVEHTMTCDLKRSAIITTLCGTSCEESMYMSEQQFFANIVEEDYSKVMQEYNDLIAGKIEKSRGEYRVRVNNNGKQTIEWLEVQAIIDERDEDGKAISLIGSSVVITERKNMEEELRSAKERAEESNRLKSAFLANMSHEIRTPLNAIIGFSSIMASTEIGNDRKEYAKIIEYNNDLLLQLIGDVLDISKIEAGTLEFCYSDVELNQLMDELQNVMSYRAESRNLQLIAKIPESSCYVYTERNRLMQVMNNLLTNALKFTTQGSITFGYELHGHEIYFYVTDTGCGIPAEKRKAIFKRFVKLDTFVQGTGLGLTICQTIVEYLGGHIGVESEEGEGSTFWFTIPYAPGQIYEESNC